MWDLRFSPILKVFFVFFTSMFRGCVHFGINNINIMVWNLGLQSWSNLLLSCGGAEERLFEAHETFILIQKESLNHHQQSVKKNWEPKRGCLLNFLQDQSKLCGDERIHHLYFPAIRKLWNPRRTHERRQERLNRMHELTESEQPRSRFSHKWDKK